jgi:hypothetical protein
MNKGCTTILVFQLGNFVVEFQSLPYHLLAPCDSLFSYSPMLTTPIDALNWSKALIIDMLMVDLIL